MINLYSVNNFMLITNKNLAELDYITVESNKKTTNYSQFSCISHKKDWTEARNPKQVITISNEDLYNILKTGFKVLKERKDIV